MADDGASDSEGSDISGVDKFINEDFEGELAGENVDPLPWIECRSYRRYVPSHLCPKSLMSQILWTICPKNKMLSDS